MTILAARPTQTLVPFLFLTVFAIQASALFCGEDDCFALLGVTRNASKSEIRRAYRRISSEKHPDKKPGDEQALEEFRKIGTAYETLTDDGKRAKYEDFLDNPGKYWQYFMDNAKEVYAPKSNVFLVITGLVGIATLIHWLNMNNTYKQTLLRLRETQEFKREVTRLVKSKKAASKEEAESMINLDVVGLEEPDWRNLIVFKLLAIPGQLGKLALWKINWFIRYRVRKLEYTDEDKVYLIQKNLKISEEDWQNVSEKDKDTFIKEELWLVENSEEYLFRKRIEMNRLGKTKKKKKRPVSSFAEADEVGFSD